MVFEIDPDSKSLVARLSKDGSLEEFDCIFTICKNPACSCQAVTIRFAARIASNLIQSETAQEYEVGLDLAARTLDHRFRKTAAQSDMAFAEALLAAMELDDFDLLLRLLCGIKKRASERAKPSEINAQFDFDEIERQSIMQGYNDILPFSETFLVVVDGIEYVALDQYCLKSGCGCTKVHFNLLETNQEAGPLATTFSADVDYDTRTWQASSDGKPPLCDVVAFGHLMESTIPDFYEKLKARHNKLAAIYAHARKRARPAVSESTAQKSVGRNDPCPCGSGKKFKKCCLGKDVSGLARKAPVRPLFISR